MLLSSRFLDNVSSVNSFDFVDKVEFFSGDQATVTLQLIDASLDKENAGFRPLTAGRRFVPASGATLQVILKNLDDAKTYTKVASQPFPTTDPSIWQFSISAADAVSGTVSLQLTLTEGAVIRRSLIKAALRVYPISSV